MHELFKLRQAEHSLGRMRTEVVLDTFLFALSDFTTAARTALQYAHNEVTGSTVKPGAQKWYDDHVSKNDVLKFLKDVRNTDIHEIPPTVARVYDVPLQSSLGFRSELQVYRPEQTIPERTITEEFSPTSGTGTNVRSVQRISAKAYFPNWTGTEDIVSLCTQALKDLHEMVKEGQEKGYLTP